ncbi:copper homeostasis protein CutC [Gemelliphila palaticanis]|uniref:Copper homeostasis protein cutC homolog n=1 Tax=Gemelliphila palaticanis TaxID=81950 RepID=A0ABX2SZR6_9BACL|nr:copper homeostasis protein CutC [Gemella palaticanis]MBF0715860.1 copper homeostasis protein CutC [Gemella palaticanis]NYS47790.1 copper homeostasis protein CutC [Gemella palaticanis]
MAKLEVIATNKDDILKIDFSKASRIELVEELEKGGLTPNLDLIKFAKENSDLPIRIMIRPHDKSFNYDNEDIEQMKRDIDNVKNIGCEGVVFGVLNEDNELNFEAMQQLVKIAKPMKITFHRAIDDIPTNKLEETLLKLESLKIDTILTSLGHIEEEKDKRFNILKNSQIEVMYGSGVSVKNIDIIKEKFPLEFYHVGSSARKNNCLKEDIVVEKIDDIVDKIS